MKNKFLKYFLEIGIIIVGWVAIMWLLGYIAFSLAYSVRIDFKPNSIDWISRVAKNIISNGFHKYPYFQPQIKTSYITFYAYALYFSMPVILIIYLFLIRKRIAIRFRAAKHNSKKERIARLEQELAELKDKQKD